MGGWITILNQTSQSLRRQMEQMAKLSAQASSGTRFTKASESPAEGGRILQLQAQDRRNETCRKNLQVVSDGLEQSSAVLGEISNMIIRARELATQAASGTYGQEERSALGHEIDGLVEQAVMLANSRTSGQYYFGGGNSFSDPFTVQRQDGRITDVQYQGGLDEMGVEVAPGVTYPGQIVGSVAFGVNNRQGPQFLGNTGLAGGSGTSSVEGPQYVSVTHGTTTYTGGGGVSAGASSPAGDTLLGTHTLAIDRVARTVSLDGGPPQSFASAASLADLAVTNAAGDKVYVNLTAVAANYKGTATVKSTAKLSLDDGLSTTALLPGPADVSLADSRNQHVLWVNTAGLARTGVEPVSVRGTGDLFDELIDLRDVLLNQRNLPQTRQLQLLSSSVGTLDELNSAVISQSTLAGGRLEALTNLGTSVDNFRNYLQDEKSSLQNVDIAQVAMEITRVQTLYQMTLQATGKILSLNLLDFLQ